MYVLLKPFTLIQNIETLLSSNISFGVRRKLSQISSPVRRRFLSHADWLKLLGILIGLLARDDNCFLNSVMISPPNIGCQYYLLYICYTIYLSL